MATKKDRQKKAGLKKGKPAIKAQKTTSLIILLGQCAKHLAAIPITDPFTTHHRSILSTSQQLAFKAFNRFQCMVFAGSQFNQRFAFGF